MVFRRLRMNSWEETKAKLALIVLYLHKADARDKICMVIQFGSKFLSNGESGTAQDVEKSTAMGRKVFRLFKFLNGLNAIISPVPKGTPLPLVVLGKSSTALVSLFLFIDQIVWLNRTGIYKDTQQTEKLGRVALYCFLGSAVCSTLAELGELGRLSRKLKRMEGELKGGDKHKNGEYCAKTDKSKQRSLALVKSTMDMVLAVGLLRLAPNKLTPRVTGAFGLATSLISCYQLFPSQPKAKTS